MTVAGKVTCGRCKHTAHDGRCTFNMRAHGKLTGTADGICPCDARVIRNGDMVLCDNGKPGIVHPWRETCINARLATTKEGH